MKNKISHNCLMCGQHGKQYYSRALTNWMRAAGFALEPWESCYLCDECAEVIEQQSGVPFAQKVMR